MSRTDELKIKQDRKRVLEYLHMLYPSSIRVGGLYQTIVYVAPAYDEALYRKDIYWLKESGYVEFVDEVIGGFKDFMAKVVKLTAKGDNIATGLEKNTALEI